MPHSFSALWLHIIYATKNRAPLIEPAAEHFIHEATWKELVELGSVPRIINGMSDHLHILTRLPLSIAVKDLVKQVKGAVSHAVNAENRTVQKFAWQVGYAAYSVSKSRLKIVEQYIAGQKEHHQKQTFKEEYDEFIRQYGAQEE